MCFQDLYALPSSSRTFQTSISRSRVFLFIPGSASLRVTPRNYLPTRPIVHSTYFRISNQKWCRLHRIAVSSRSVGIHRLDQIKSKYILVPIYLLCLSTNSTRLEQNNWNDNSTSETYRVPTSTTYTCKNTYTKHKNQQIQSII